MPGRDTTAFWARRFAHEAAIHRADAALAAGIAFGADGDVTVDALDEWMELGALGDRELLDLWLEHVGFG